MLKILYAGCPGLSPAISLNSVLKCALHPKIVNNLLKTAVWKVQGRSRSSTFTNLKSLSPVLVMMSRKSVPICNRFHTIQENNGRNNVYLEGYPSLMPSFKGNLLT